MSDDAAAARSKANARDFVDKYPDDVVAAWRACGDEQCVYCTEVERLRDEKNEAMKGKRHG